MLCCATGCSATRCPAETYVRFAYRTKVLKGADARMVAKLLNTKADRTELRRILQAVGGLDDAAGSTARCLSCNRPMVASLGATAPLGPITRHSRPRSPPERSMAQSQSQPVLRQGSAVGMAGGGGGGGGGGQGGASGARPQSAVPTRRQISPTREGESRGRRPQTAGPSRRPQTTAPVPFQPLVFNKQTLGFGT